MSAHVTTATDARSRRPIVTELTPPLILPTSDALSLLAAGELSVEGRITTASNATLYCRIEADGVVAACVYKPVAGERPLWDFPDGTLAEREVAAYLVSAATGMNLIPPTLLRDGPFGPGMVQLWIAEDESADVVSMINAGQSSALQRMALLDSILNNSDRKVSHLLPVPAAAQGLSGTGETVAAAEYHIYGVDHGVSFGIENKLRTVLWQWAGEPVPEEGIAMLRTLASTFDTGLGDQLAELLTTREVKATRNRINRLLRRPVFPMPPTDWPAVPYPPY